MVLVKNSFPFDKTFSVYKIETFLQCPQQYYFSYVDPVYSKLKGKLARDPENIFSFNTLGKAIHDSITLFYHQKPKERTRASLKEILKQAWRSEALWQKKPPLGKWGGFKSLEEERETYKEALNLLFNFLKIADLDPEIGYLPTKELTKSIDDFIKLAIDFDGNLKLSGKLDLVLETKEGLEVIDFKTGKTDQINDFQLRFYKVLVEEKFKKPVIKTSFYFLRKPEIKDFKIKTSNKKIKAEIKEKIDQIQQCPEFVPQPSKLCQYCLFRDLCPLKTEVNKMIRNQTGEEIPEDLPF